MQTEVHAFLSESLFEATDDRLWQQAVTSASYDGVRGVYLMPDTHLGYGIPVGGVVVTDETIIQSGSGYDISCGVIYMRTPLSAADVADPQLRQRWVDEVERRIATGIGNHRPALAPDVRGHDMDEILRYGAKALGVSADLCERQYIPVPDEVDLESIPKARCKCTAQLGSVGGGNHFIEMQVDVADASVWVMVHCGSRGYGWQTANHFFHAGAELRGLAKKARERAHLYADEPLGRRYWAHHNSAANYAIANRHTIVRGVQEALREVFTTEGEVYYEISHNLVQEETLVLPDGSTTRGFVHRKGATRAFPAGHPDLAGTRWAGSGHPCLIPGSMLSGAAILFPLAGAYRSGCSVNHGSGRVLGRGQAKRELAARHDEIDEEMRSVTRTFGADAEGRGGVTITGVIGNTARTPLDECGHVYKDLDEVLAVLETEGIARVAHRLYPVANIKGTD
ncbi:RtcB family protein [Pseudenhygromyxa sp. WMMC2535]|uniref:RtcB family protein n=1 Tax=Pseudenhygromyxa sp. WMMC2535 TaxID=2712867 RepID=UPI0020D15B8A|nr:RtcB family protein [Pseudenhygromyxa sp. WMMC2535]